MYQPGPSTGGTGAGLLVVRVGWPSGWSWRVTTFGEVLRLLDELAEPLDGSLVGAEVVAVEHLLSALVLLGLQLQDLRQRRRGACGEQRRCAANHYRGRRPR
jgi:hypothetical protein